MTADGKKTYTHANIFATNNPIKKRTLRSISSFFIS